MVRKLRLSVSLLVHRARRTGEPKPVAARLVIICMTPGRDTPLFHPTDRKKEKEESPSQALVLSDRSVARVRTQRAVRLG